MQSAEFSRAARTIRDRFGAAFAVVLLLLPFSICHADGRKVITVTANQAHEWELQLEVELLADPLTFPHAIKPQISQAGMEVHGRVPNVWIRDHALKLAKSICPVAVVDDMTVDPKMIVPIPQSQSTSMGVEARHRLERSGVKLIGPVEIKLSGNGQIGLSGQVGSMEDKLKMSRSLRALPGCTCVKNDLTVATAASPQKEIAKMAEQTKPIAKTPEVAKSMPPSPVVPVEGTLANETRFASGVAAQVAFEEEKKPSAVVQTSAKSELVPSSVTAEPAKKAEPSRKMDKSPKGPPSLQAQATLQKKLRSILGRNVRNVTMDFDDKGGATIHVKVAKLADVEKVHAAIQQSPELAGYDVNLEFVVGQ